MKSSKGMMFLLVGLAILSIATLVAMFFFFPKDSTKTVSKAPAAVPAAPAPMPGEFDPVEWSRTSQTQPAANAPATSPGDQGFTVTLPSEQTPATTSAITTPTSGGVTFPETPQTPSTVTSHPVGTTAAPRETAPPKTVVKHPVKAEPAKTETPKTEPAKSGPEYWIQVASFKDRFQAANAAKSLEQQGLKGTLTTATVNGATVVRVRVGPYADHGEAEKFLSWIKPLKGFSESFITRVGRP